jgi:hypothetical protein
MIINGVILRKIIRKAAENSIPALGLTTGKKSGTTTAVAILLSNVKDVRFWMLPPNLPAMIAAAEAVGIKTQSISPWEMMAISVGFKAIKLLGDDARGSREYCSP